MFSLCGAQPQAPAGGAAAARVQAIGLRGIVTPADFNEGGRGPGVLRFKHSESWQQNIENIGRRYGLDADYENLISHIASQVLEWEFADEGRTGRHENRLIALHDVANIYNINDGEHALEMSRLIETEWELVMKRAGGENVWREKEHLRWTRLGPEGPHVIRSVAIAALEGHREPELPRSAIEELTNLNERVILNWTHAPTAEAAKNMLKHILSTIEMGSIV